MMSKITRVLWIIAMLFIIPCFVQAATESTIRRDAGIFKRVQDIDTLINARNINARNINARNINARNIEFGTSIEDVQCSYLSCTADFVVYNNDDETPIVLDSDDISIDIHGGGEYTITTFYKKKISIPVFDRNDNVIDTTYEEVIVSRNIDESFSITIQPGQRQVFYVSATLSQANSIYKYDLVLSYNGELFVLDPTFITSDTNFDDGTYHGTVLDPAGYVALNLSSNTTGTYVSDVFDAGETATWQTVTWTQEVKYGHGLPDNNGQDVGDYYNDTSMFDNTILLHMDGGSADDSSGFGNDGTVVGATETDGRYEEGFAFDGINDRITFSFDQSLNITDQLTVESWFKLPSATLSAGYHTISSTGFSSEGHFLALHGNNYIYFRLNDGVANFATITSSSAISWEADRWYHIMASWDGSNAYIFLDGQQVGSGAAVGTIGGNLALTVGKRTNGAYYFNGTLDEVAIYDRPLTIDDAQNRFDRGASHLNTSVRSCDDAACSGESFSTITGESPGTLLEDNNRYFQYQYTFGTESTSSTAKLYNVSVEYIVAPVFSDWTATSTSNETETISLTSDQSVNATVQYGTTPALGLNSSNTTFQSSHTFGITGLSPDTLYYINTTICNSDDLCRVRSDTFETLATVIDTSCDIVFEDITDRAFNLGEPFAMKIGIENPESGYGLIRADCATRILNEHNQTVIQEPYFDNNQYAYYTTAGDGNTTFQHYLTESFWQPHTTYYIETSCVCRPGECIALDAIRNHSSDRFFACTESTPMTTGADYRVQDETSVNASMALSIFLILFLTVFGVWFISRHKKQSKAGSRPERNWLAWGYACISLACIELIYITFVLYLYESMAFLRDIYHTHWIITATVLPLFIVFLLINYIRTVLGDHVDGMR